ncbi:tRNA-dihydrouridine synthase family protein [Marinifilum sp. D714]|uniref:tRNA-dihydrouridine synthase family protein n=1 Tax=Marinifilum sp. D714 TaxID=2937523 RepID=UPI0027CC1574|nr:tRNA-dihydrouridine synthase family protein [Marinifilum sp. D714]MDQ2179427.1 tRNA-dihydrouridine synthase family protein [Marinifilum sp. D714]
MKISLAPLQGYTDWVFRQAYQKNIGGIDEFYTPFLVLQNDGIVKTAHKREVEPYESRCNDLIPQFLCGSSEELSFFETYFSELGYLKMNWNMGCPYPMVTKKGKGSGLLPNPDKVKEILKTAFHNKLELSVKLRLGLVDDSEVDSILPFLKDYNVSEVILHPRIGKQLYKGKVNLNRFNDLYEKYGSYIGYNGDVCCKEDFDKIKSLFPNLQHVMIGRGLLKDYWLPHKLKGIALPDSDKRRDQLEKMHNDIFQLYSSYLQGDSQIMQKMKPYWEYFSSHFENDKKVFKAIKKSAGIKKYEQAVEFAFSQQLKLD